MSWLTRLAESTVAAWERLGWVQRPRPQVNRVQRPSLRESVAGPPGTASAAYWGGQKVIRDLTPWQHSNLIGMAEFLVANDARAARLMDIRTSLVCGEGWSPKATSEDPAFRDAVQRHADRVWECLGWEENAFRWIRDLGVTGELIHARLAPNVYEGCWEPAILYPGNVREILQHPLNLDRLTTLVLHYPGLEWEEDGQPRRQERFRLVRRELFGPQRGRLTGEVFLLQANRFPMGTRGLSDTLPWREWVDMYGQALYVAQDRLRALASVLWDVELDESDEDRLEARKLELKEEGAPKGNSVRLHSPQETWTVQTPSLGASEFETILLRLEREVLGAAGVPYMWWTDGGDTNRATAREQDAPVYASTRNRKREVAAFMRLEVDYALQDVADTGALVTADGQQVPPGERGVEIQSRDPDRTAYDAVALTLKTLGEAMAVAVAQGRLSDEEADMVYRSVAQSETGLTLPERKPVEGEPESELDRSMRQAAEELERAKARLQRPGNGNGKPSPAGVA